MTTKNWNPYRVGKYNLFISDRNNPLKTLHDYYVNNNFSSIIDQNHGYTDGEKKIGYWENRWATGQSQWHKKDVNPFLSKYFEDLKVINRFYR